MIINNANENEVDNRSSHVRFIAAYKAAERNTRPSSRTHYLICSKWMAKFRTYCQNPDRYPNMITNSGLLTRDFDWSKLTDTEDASAEEALCTQTLREGMVEHNDYVIINADQWMLLEEKFQCDVAIPRMSHNYNDEMFVEVYPLNIQYRISGGDDDGNNNNGRAKSKSVMLSGSKFVTLGMFLGKLGDVKRVWRQDTADGIEDLNIDHRNCGGGNEEEEEGTELQMHDVMYEILTKGDTIIVDLGDASSVTAMMCEAGEGVHSQVDDLSMEDMLADVNTLGDGITSDDHDHNYESNNGTSNALIAYTGPAGTVTETAQAAHGSTDDNDNIISHSTNKAMHRVHTNTSQYTTAAKHDLVTNPISVSSTPKGLANLGNTCFMNATLQSLASLPLLTCYYTHHEDLYVRDMNLENVLGTGGKLARAFAGVINELLEIPGRTSSSTSSSSSGWLGAVSPRNFKVTLGQFASQFMGFDQHDCQELATYLLDALHEDCNLIHKKPYVEKPEKKVDESDYYAARIAWNAHLQREHSYLVKHFHFLMKSHVECPTCDKYSITFDPMVYLSVPIPCSNDTTIPVTYVPLYSTTQFTFKITLDKSSNMKDLMAKVYETILSSQQYQQYSDVRTPLLTLEDMCAVDVYNSDVYSFYNMGDSVDTINSTDTPHVYQLMPHSAATTCSVEGEVSGDDNDDGGGDNLGAAWLAQSNLHQLSLPEVDAMLSAFSNSKKNKTSIKISEQYYQILNNALPDRILVKSRRNYMETIQYLSRLQGHIKEHKGVNIGMHNTKTILHSALMLHSETLRTKSTLLTILLQKTDSPSTLSTSGRHNNYSSINSKYNRTTCTKKVGVQVVRIPPNTTVYGLRKMMAECVRRGWVDVEEGFVKAYEQEYNDYVAATAAVSVVQDDVDVDNDDYDYNSAAMRGMKADGRPVLLEVDAVAVDAKDLKSANNPDDSMAADTLHSSSTTSDEEIPPLISSAQCTAEDSAPSATPACMVSPVPITSNALFDIYRRLPLTYSKKNGGSYSSGVFSKQLGCVVYDRNENVRRSDVMDSNNHSRSSSLIDLKTASEEEEGEDMFVSQLVGNNGTVQVNIPPSLHTYMDSSVFSTTTPLQDDDKEDDETKGKKSDKITLIDCIEAFTNREQLSMSESYYCSTCKDHVQAHKQCSVYFAPNVLVVHLKRFYFSSVSHRRDKIEALVDYPVRGLDLRETVMQQGSMPVADHADESTNSTSEKEKQQQHETEGDQLPPIYDLQAVSNHYGGLGGGHYTAYAKRDDKWYHFDDSRVTEIENEADVVTSAGYVLYYVRRGVTAPDEMSLRHMNDMNMDTQNSDDSDAMICTSAMQVHAPNSAMSSMMMEEDDVNAGKACDYDHRFNGVNPQGDGDDDGGTVLLAEL